MKYIIMDKGQAYAEMEQTLQEMRGSIPWCEKNRDIERRTVAQHFLSVGKDSA